MYEHSEKRLVDRLKMEAGFHGIKLEDDNHSAATPPKTRSGTVPGDPDSYSHLSMEERKALTRKMMGRHKAWDATDKPMGGKDPIDKR